MTSANPQKPVRSAAAVAMLRAASGRERDATVRNPDYLAQHFAGVPYGLLLKLPRSLSRRVIERISPGSYCYFLARTKFIDGHLLNALTRGVRQVVILGAGYDSRASRFANLLEQDARVFEVDLPSTQAHKRSRMRACGLQEPHNTVYVAHDFNAGALNRALQRHGFVPTQQTFFIWEGVTYYLEPRSVDDVLRGLVGNAPAGSSVAFDYSLRTFVDGDQSTYGGKTMQKWLKKNNERFRFGLHPDELPGYLGTFGLSVTEDLGPADITQRYLRDGRSRQLGQPLGHLRLVHATVTHSPVEAP